MTSDPAVDVVIAVHDETRRVDRAVASLLDGGDLVRVTVVCHGVAEKAIRARLGPLDPRVRLVEYSDGQTSPAGPFNHGLRLASAPFVMIMGSDDFLEPGAISAWIGSLRRGGADIVLAPLRHQNGVLLANPLTRPGRRHRLDPVRDRLFHRTAPLALIRRDLMGAEGPLTPGMPVGEDLAWSCALWTSGRRIDFDRRLPAYVIGADAETRITMVPRPVKVVLAPVDALLASEWAHAQPERVRTALVAKLLRVNVIGALRARPQPEAWPSDAREALSSSLGSLAEYGPRGFEDLPREDRALLDEAASRSNSAERLADAIARHRAAGRVGRLLPRRLTRSFGRESVLRRYVRQALDGRPRR